MTQNQMLLSAMEAGLSFTPLEALNYCGTMKLATRISELRALGHKIKDRWVEDRLTGKRYKKYWMDK